MIERLYPDAGQVEITELLSEFDPGGAAGPRRPHLYTNFVTSLDGHATLEGRSGELAGDADLQMLLGLRERADAVMVGAGTLRAERYGRIVASDERRARREAAGLAPDPLAVVISDRLQLPWDIPLFTSGAGEVVIFTASDGESAETPTPHTIVRHPGGVDLERAMEELRTEYGIRGLLCEGGPTLHGSLLDADLVDELFVTFGPRIVGGLGPGIATHIEERSRNLELRWLLRDGSDVFTRYGVVR